MRGMILAAGEGRRMQPLTLTRAKPSLPVLGTPLVGHAARLLRDAGITEVVVNLHHQGRSVVQALDRERRDPHETKGVSLMRFRWSREETLLGTAGGIGRVSSWLAEGGRTIVTNSDFLSDLDVRALLEAHERSGAVATLVGVEPFGPFPGELWTDPSGRLLSIGAPPEGDAAKSGVSGPLEFTGVQVLEPELLARFPDRRADSVRDVYIPALPEGRVFVWKHPGWWWEFGALGRFLEGHRRLLGEGRGLHRGAIERREGAVAWLGPGANLSVKATLRGSVVICTGAVVSADSFVEDCVILEGAHVAQRCRLTRCIIASDTVLTGGSRFEDVAAASSPCIAPSGLAGAPETPLGRIAPPEGCRIDGDLWVRPIPR